ATCSSLVTSATNTLAWPPRACDSSATAFNCFSLRDTNASVAPLSARAKAIALPRPLLAPVMTATLPFRLFRLSWLIHHSSPADLVGLVDDPVGHRLRPVDVREGQPAGFPGCLNREIADTCHPLEQGLPHRDVLHLRKLNRARRFGKHPRLI